MILGLYVNMYYYLRVGMPVESSLMLLHAHAIMQASKRAGTGSGDVIMTSEAIDATSRHIMCSHYFFCSSFVLRVVDTAGRLSPLPGIIFLHAQ